MHRFYLHDQEVLSQDQLVLASDELLHQWKNVLRFRVGEKVVVFDGARDEECVVQIDAFERVAVLAHVVERRIVSTELPRRIILAQSILKNPEKFEWVLQKGTELGVSEFYPLITKRTERESLNKMDRLNRIIIEAVEQSGRTRVPVLHEPILYEKFLKKMSDDGVKVIVPDFSGEHKISSLDGDGAVFSLCIGPEGGFDSSEVTRAREAGCAIVTLGPRVLRSETAAITALSILTEQLR